MKKLFCIFLTAWIMVMTLSLLHLSAAPKAVYVTDGGKGDGSAEASPLGSLTKAYNALGTDGGEIILCGTVTLPKNQIGTTQTAFVEPAHDGKITLRGLNENAVLKFGGVYQFHASGETEFKNLILDSGSYVNGIDIAARGHHLTMGEGLSMRSSGNVSGEVGTKIYLYGGWRNGVTEDGYVSKNTYLTVKSGSYWFVGGFNRNLNVTATGKAAIEIGGDVHTRFFVAGSTGTSAFATPAGADISVIGNLSVSNQLSLGNQNSVVEYFDVNLLLKDGYIDFTGSVTDFGARQKLTNLDIYVNTNSESAVRTYNAIFRGYGDSEKALSSYCKSENSEHNYEDGVCTICGSKKDAVECNEHDFALSANGSVTVHTCKNCGYCFKTTSKAVNENSGFYSFENNNIRVQLFSDTLLRIEEAANGGFEDRQTLVVTNRTDWSGVAAVRDEDSETVILKTEAYTLNIPKTAAFASDVKIFGGDNEPIYDFFETETANFYASLPAPADTPNSYILADNRIIPADTGLTYAESEDENSGWSRNPATDLYVFLPRGNAAKLRADFVRLTGRTLLSDIKTLGAWYSKWTNYTAAQKLSMVAKWRTENVPLDMIVIDTEWKNTSTNGNDGDGTGYDINTALYPDMEAFLAAANEAGVLVLFNDHTHQTSLTITTPSELKWQCAGINALMKLGLDGWWYDRNWSYSIKSPWHDVLYTTVGQVLYYDTMEKYHADTAGGSAQKRVLMLTNVDWIKHGHITGSPSLIGHRYGIQWTGDIYGDTLSIRMEIENLVKAGVNGANPYLSSDLGGFRNNDHISENTFRRWIQFGAFAPVFRIHSTLSAKNEQLPWSYGEDTENIMRDYLNMRYNLLPLWYSLARENYDTGLPLARRLDFEYPQYSESASDTQYLLGKDLLVAPFWSTQGDGQYIIPEDWLKNKTGENGLDAAYYNTAKEMAKTEYFSATPVLTQTEKELNFFWDADSPNAKVNKDYFAARYTGKITPAVDCYIGTLADDGARIYIDGKLWSDGWAVSIIRPALNTQTPLKAGKTYDIAVEYYELSGKAQLYLVWEPVVGTDCSKRDVFIPDGEWIDVFSGTIYTGPQTVAIVGDSTVMPLFIRRGAVLPAAEVVSPIESADWPELSLNVYAGGNGAYTLYEDDGETENYLTGAYRKTQILHSIHADTVEQIQISPAIGDFGTEYTARTWTLRIHSDKEIRSATVNGRTVQVKKLEKDSSANPFAESGASPNSNVYEISFTENLSTEINILFSQIEDVLPVLGGTVSIDGTPVFGQELTANITALDYNGDQDGLGTATGTTTYQWLRDGAAIAGAASDKYALTEQDVGKIISVMVSNTAYSGAKTAAAAVVEKAACATPVVSAATNQTSDSVTITNVTAGQEYAIVKKADALPVTGWNTTGIFTGLDANTEYTVYTRVAETATHKASAVSKTAVTTEKLAQIIAVSNANPTVTIGGELDLAALCSSNASGATLTYTVEDAIPTGVALTADGKVTATSDAVAGSTLTVKVNSAAVGDYAAAAEKIITVTVTAKKTQIFESGFDAAVNKTYGDADFTKAAVLSSGDGTVSYKSSDESVATVNASTGEVKILKNGTATITATAEETAGFAEASIRYILTVAQREAAIRWANTAGRIYSDGKVVTAVIINKVDGDDVALNVAGGDKIDVGGPYTAAAALTGTDAEKYMLSDANTTTYSIGKAAQAAPTGLAGVKPTSVGGTSGKITGVTDKMEYAAKTDFSDKKACTGTEITGLAAGKYYVRYAETATHKASAYTEVTVPAKTSGGGSGTAVANYTLTFEVNGGSEVQKVIKSRGTTIDLAGYKPTKEGYEFAGWYSDKALTEEVTSVKLTKSTTVYAKWTKKVVAPIELPFTDITEKDWFCDNIAFVFEKGIMTGVSDTLFAPQADTTRGMIVTMLYRLEGQLKVTGDCPFDDVQAGAWYADAITWAVANKIVNGYGDSFGAEDPITREQMATVLYNYAAFKGYDGGDKADLTKFADNGEISVWAEAALSWANANALVTGKSGNTLEPKGNAARCEVAAILHRFCNVFIK